MTTMTHFQQQHEIRRNMIRAALDRVFQTAGGIPSPESEKWARNLEKHIHNWTIAECTKIRMVPCCENPKVVQIYSDKCKALLCNLDPARTHVKNPNLIHRVCTQEISLQDLVYECTHRDYFPERYVEYDAECEREEQKIAEFKRSQEEDLHDGLLKCRRCKSMKTTYTMVQTRSADEPSTLKVQCQKCGLRWSQSA